MSIVVEKLILEELEKEDAELAEEIRQRMFIFEDIITLDDASIQRVIREIDSKDLAKAMKGTGEEVRNAFSCISKRATEMLRRILNIWAPLDYER